MKSKKCKSSHRYEFKFVNLPKNQSGSGRHKCAACAYKAGYELGLLNWKNMYDGIDQIPESQAGTVRHKCPYKAMELGYLRGKAANQILN
tara:strand:+ start:1669 stop:1938 length:270 start_codon:yes stop_codon:yes gene_type:complete